MPASRYVAGCSRAEALSRAAACSTAGTGSAATLFGELVRDPMAAERVVGTRAARPLVLLASGADKAESVRWLVEGPVSTSWPATALQLHPHVTVLLDDAAAYELERLAWW